MSPLSNIDILILNQLQRTNAYGYALRRIFPHTSNTQIYYSLQKLLGMDLIESRLKDSRGNPRRRIYRLTKRGRHYIFHRVHGDIESHKNHLTALLDEYLLYKTELNTFLKHLDASGSQYRTLS